MLNLPAGLWMFFMWSTWLPTVSSVMSFKIRDSIFRGDRRVRLLRRLFSSLRGSSIESVTRRVSYIYYNHVLWSLITVRTLRYIYIMCNNKYHKLLWIYLCSFSTAWNSNWIYNQYLLPRNFMTQTELD